MSIAITATELLAHSAKVSEATSFSKYGWVGFIIIGAIAGWLAGKFVETGIKQGLILDIVIGVAGALIGGYVSQRFFGTTNAGFWKTLLIATLGSVVLLWVIRLVKKFV